MYLLVFVHFNEHAVCPILTDVTAQRSILQTKLNRLAVQIGFCGLSAAILCLAVLFMRFSIKVPVVWLKLCCSLPIHVPMYCRRLPLKISRGAAVTGAILLDS
jgi:hypothetical protein